MQPQRDVVKLFMQDFNFTVFDKWPKLRPPSSASDYADIDADEVFDFSLDLGVNAIYCHAITINGCALYPSRLAPVSAGNMGTLAPALYERARKAGLPFWTYFSIAQDGHMSQTKPQWLVPNTDFLAPETPWTDLLCERIAEFLSICKPDWIGFDAFTYGSFWPDRFRIRPAPFVRPLFEELFGKAMPEEEADITPEESRLYIREVLARQFYRIRDTVREHSPQTKICFNVPFWEPAEAVWVDHPMLRESDGLIAESANDELAEYLLTVKAPDQKLFLTLLNFIDGFRHDLSKWQHWLERGCDFHGYAWGTPPDWRPSARFAEAMASMRTFFHSF